MLPKDPVMLLSVVNMKLRDFYTNLEDLCRDYNITSEELCNKLKEIDYIYSKDQNQFI